MVQKKILVADDEKDIVDLIAFNLEREGFAVATARNGRQVMDRVRVDKPDLLILDLMMPEVTGEEVCRRIRSDTATVGLPIIILTAKADPVDRIIGLEIGADDYITKPFHIRELVARVRAVLRRSEQKVAGDLPDVFDFQGLHVDLRSYRAAVDGKEVELSSREFRLLYFLIGNPGRVFTRDQLLDRVWGDEAFVEPRTVDVHISRLRAAIEPDKANPRYILTVRGIGYKFADRG
jgi:DNA-binding response OmpR family regulator